MAGPVPGDQARQARGAAEAAPPVWLRPLPLALLVAALTTLRLLVAAKAGLAEDEAYYRLWGLHPAAGYYDHPPMVAWFAFLGQSLFGDTAFGLRFFSVLSAAIGSAAIWRTGLLLYGAREAGYAVLFLNASLLIGAGSLLATPDAASVLFWGLAIWALAELTASENPWWWIAVGLFAGLGLNAKYSVLFLGAGIVLHLVFVPQARRWWGAWQLWAGGLLAALLVAPVIGWNAAHDWASFTKQFGRAVPEGWSTRYLPEFVGAVIGLANPLVAVLAGIGLVRIARAALRGEPAGGLLLWTSLPFVVYLLAHSLHSRVQGNWPAPLFPVIALAAALVAANPPLRPGPRFWNRFSAVAVALGLAVSAVVYVHAVAPLTGALARKDPTHQIRGWAEISAELQRLASEQEAAWIATDAYGLNAQLAWQLDRAMPVEQVDQRIRYAMRPEPDAGLVARPALFVAEERRDPGPERLSARFAEVERIAVLTRLSDSTPVERLVVYRVADPRVGGPFDPVYPLP